MKDKLKQMLAMSPREFQSISCDDVETLMLHSLLGNAIKGDANAVSVVAVLAEMPVTDSGSYSLMRGAEYYANAAKRRHEHQNQAEE